MSRTLPGDPFLTFALVVQALPHPHRLRAARGACHSSFVVVRLSPHRFNCPRFPSSRNASLRQRFDSSRALGGVNWSRRALQCTRWLFANEAAAAPRQEPFPLSALASHERVSPHRRGGRPGGRQDVADQDAHLRGVRRACARHAPDGGHPTGGGARE
eukprot:ctg_137.g70